jgi:hypothetical protein
LGKKGSAFEEKLVPCLGKIGSVLGKNKLRFGLEIGSVFGLAWDESQVSLF